MDEPLATVLDSGAAWDAEPVPHAQPLITEALNSEALNSEALNSEALTTDPLTDDQLNQQISDTLPELFKHFHELSQRIATEFGMNGSDAIALLKLDAPMTMKELGQRMGCDPSFITTIADTLEKHGLAPRWSPRSGTGARRTSADPGGRNGQGPAVPRDPVPGAAGDGARHRRAPVPARAPAEDDQISRWEVMVSQSRRLPRQQ